MKKKPGKTKKKAVIGLLIAIAVILVLVLLLSLKMASMTMTGRRQTLEEGFAWQSAHYDTSFYETLEKSRYTVTSYDGYVLHVEFLKNPSASDRYILISHGYTDNRMGALKYAKMYLNLGFNCIIYDLRGHGENEKTFTSYGIREGKDIAALVEDTRTRYPDLKQLGLHGESLGAASTISALQYRPEVDFAVADCGFSDIENVLRGGYKLAHVPGILFELSDLGARLRYHYALKDMRPIDALDENEVPILFLHGAEDAFIVPKNSEDMAKRTKGPAELHLIEGAGHAESILVSPEEYERYVSAFLQSLDEAERSQTNE